MSIVQSQRNYVLGLILLGIVVILWTLSNFVTQGLMQNGFQKPFLVTYLNTSSFFLYLLPFIFRRIIRSGLCNVRNEFQASEHERLLLDPDLEREDILRPAESNNHPLDIRETSDLALIFCFLWFLANWTVNASLAYTSVASATILSSTSGFFTLVIGRIFMVETLTPFKILAVILGLSGVSLVSLSDSSLPKSFSPPTSLQADPNNTIAVFGDFLSLISSVFYASYTTLLKVRIGSESRIDMQLFFGFVGLYNILLCWVPGLILHVSGIETFELPDTRPTIVAILINMFVTFVSDYLYTVAMLKTTPLVVTLGLSLTIPLAVAGDVLLGTTVRLQVLFGALLVLISFCLVGLAGGSEHNIKRSEPEGRDAAR